MFFICTYVNIFLYQLVSFILYDVDILIDEELSVVIYTNTAVFKPVIIADVSVTQLELSATRRPHPSFCFV